MIRPVAALSALMLLGACASGEPGSFGISKSTGGSLLGGAGGAFLGAATSPRRECYYDAWGRRVCDQY